MYAIDFGTTNSLIAFVEPGKRAKPLSLGLDSEDRSSAITRTVVYTPERDHWSLGQSAIDAYSGSQASGRLLRSFKKYLPDPGFKGTMIHGKQYALHDLVAVFLKGLRERANSILDKDIDRVVLGRPAMFSLNKDHDTLAEERLKTGAKLAGFKEIHFCPEPIAAAFDFRHTLTSPKLTLIADFGGGTSDFTILKLSREAFVQQDILSLGGVSVAGDAFDGSIMRHFIAPDFGSKITYKMPTGSNILRVPNVLISKMCSPADIAFLGKQDTRKFFEEVQRWSVSPEQNAKLDNLFTLIEENLGFSLFQSIEQTKVGFSKQSLSDFSFKKMGIDIHKQINTRDFAEGSQGLVKQILGELKETLLRAQVKPSDIEIVCCTGGTARIPMIKKGLEDLFGPEKLSEHENFHSVIQGLAEAGKSWFL